MKILQEPNRGILKLLKPDARALSPFRKYTFCDEYRGKRGILLFHFVTGEALLLENADFSAPGAPDTLNVPALTPVCVEYLLLHRFIVSEGNEDFRDVDHVRQILRLMERLNFDGISRFTILTTTDCNARCAYCYEKNFARITMSEKTAGDVADYILKNSRQSAESPLRLSWFGGEPLCNARAIDIICRKLAEAGKTFVSSMVSNGLLLDRETIAKAVRLWKLQNVQITLDGTEAVYNRTKAYIGGVANAYQTVLVNMESALSAGIRVSVRLNISEDNIEDLSRLADELAERFPAREPNVYGHLLFQYDEDGRAEVKRALCAKHQRLKERLTRLGFSPSAAPLALVGNPQSGGGAILHTHHCMADNPGSVVILPDGGLHSCEHINANRIWGSIYTGESKLDRCHPSASEEGAESPLDYWADYVSSVECRKCAIYPFCLKLKRCPDRPDGCDFEGRDRILRRIEATERYIKAEAEK